MKKLWSALLAAAMVLSLCACGKGNDVTVTRSFLAGYNAAGEAGSEISGSRVLMNLMSDGTAEFYVGQVEDGVHTTAQYAGTYTLGENEEFDETISLTYSCEEGKRASAEDAVIIDGIFEMPFCFAGEVEDQGVSFYETAPAAMDGDIYVGYMTKVGGMGPMVYAYSLCLKEEGAFDVSIMQMASVMHVWGATHGTYAVDGENVTFTYDIRTTEGEVVSAGETTQGTGYSDSGLMTSFNIQQATMRASAAPFIKVN